MLPEEDRGPAWLRDYGNTDFGATEFGDIAADIAAMAEFAEKLAADVTKNYLPHMNSVGESMTVKLPDPATTFPELVEFMTAHHAAQTVTQENVYSFAGGTNRFALAAQAVSEQYRGADAFAQARVRDVDKAFEDVAITPRDGAKG